jgi:ABC-type lipoprotein release transport system permease subunit
MGCVWMRARAEVRSHLAAVLVLAVIVGVIGGVVIAAAAGARRTVSAYPRLLEAKSALSQAVDVTSRDPVTSRSILSEVERLPQVSAYGSVQLALGHLQIPGRRAPGNVFPIVSVDGRFGNTINGIKILQGRMYDPNAAGEVVPSFSVADELGLHVGETIRLVYGGIVTNAPHPHGFTPPPPVRLRVVGIGAAPGFFAPLAGGYLPAVILPPAFSRVHHDFLDDSDLSAAIVLRRGIADERGFLDGVNRLREHLPPHSRIALPFNQFHQTVGVQQSTRVQAVALWVLAALVALAGIAVFTQSLTRQAFLESVEYPTLRSLGMSPRQLISVGIVRAAVIGMIAAGIAVAVGFALSPLLPTGLARIAEPDPGFAFDGVTIGIGALSTLLIVMLVSALPAWRASRMAGNALGTAEVRGADRPSAVAGFLSRTAFPPSATAGVRMALEPGRGRTAVPVRATMFGATLSLVALAASLVFGASLNHLVATPGLSGWNWDFMGFPGGGPNVAAASAKLDGYLSRSPQVRGYAAGSVGNLRVGGVGVLTLSMESRKGDVGPSVVEGRLATGSGEIMLGRETMQRLGVGIGDSVEVTGDAGSRRMRVVGRLVMPPLFFTTARPGQGAGLSSAGLARVSGGPENGYGVFVRLAPGVAQRTFVSDLRRRVGPMFLVPHQESQQIHALGGAGSAPVVLAAVVALMAAATLGHTLITSIRRRRLDLAILKTLGFSRRQVSSTVAWQATALAVVALLIGIPLGVFSGRWAWILFADRLGVVPSAAVPIIAVLLAVPATIVVANLLAVVPGRIASRMKAGPVLRSE